MHHAPLMAANALVGRQPDYNVSRKVLLESLAILPSTHTSLLLERFSIFPHRSVFKNALLVYTFLHSGYPKKFEAFLKPRHSVYT